MDDEIRRLRSDARRLAQGKPRSQVRYPEGFRRAATALARRHQGRGGSLTRLARELGVSEPTLTKWLRAPAGPGLRPVSVIAVPPAPAPGARPVLITRAGVRVEGLEGAALIAVLRALA